MTATERVEEVVALLGSYRIPQGTERQLQDGIATLLAGERRLVAPKAANSAKRKSFTPLSGHLHEAM
jgi:hypothetical protein